MKKLKDAYPEAIICIDMEHNIWVRIGNRRYKNAVICDAEKNMYRIWLWDDYYYFKL